MYLNSDKIHVFPFGSTRKVEPIARIMNEQNISKLIRNLTDVTGFVISYDSETHVMEFMIYGYYFKADLTSVIEEGLPLYSYIQVEKDTGNDYEYLLGGDLDGVETSPDTTQFTGVTFVNSANNVKGYSLYILDENGNVPPESRSKFSADSLSWGSGNSGLQIDFITCGTSTEVID